MVKIEIVFGTFGTTKVLKVGTATNFLWRYRRTLLECKELQYVLSFILYTSGIEL